MLLTHEQIIEVQNWRAASAMTKDSSNGKWAHVKVLDNGNIVLVCGVNNNFTGVFISDGVSTDILTKVAFDALHPLYKKHR